MTLEDNGTTLHGTLNREQVVVGSGIGHGVVIPPVHRHASRCLVYLQGDALPHSLGRGHLDSIRLRHSRSYGKQTRCKHGDKELFSFHRLISLKMFSK